MPSHEAQAVLKLNSDLRDAWLADPNYTFDDMRKIFEDCSVNSKFRRAPR